MNKKNKCLAGILSMALVATLVGGTIMGVSANQREKSNVTGQSVSTIKEFESTGVSTYIGQGYDVISKGYINAGDITRDHYIFNVQDTENGKSIRDTNIIVDTGTNTYKDYQVKSDSQSELIKNFNTTINAKLTVDQPWFPFTQITPSISASYTDNKDYKNYTYYKKTVRKLDTEYATWLVKEDDYYDYLTDEFKKDVVSMDAQALFSKYGTHFLKSVELGGRLDFTYALESDSKKDIDDVSVLLDLNVDNVLSKITEGANKLKESGKKAVQATSGEKVINQDTEQKNFEFGTDITRKVKNVKANLYITCFGGNRIEFSSVGGENGFDKDGNFVSVNGGEGNVRDWIGSVAGKPALVGVPSSDSLVPVWTLLDGMFANGDITEEVYNARKAELEEAFNKYGKDNFEKITNSDFRNEVASVQPIEVESKSVAVKTNTNFDKKYTLGDKVQALHKESPLGTVILVNAKKNGENYATTNKGLKIRFRLDQDPKSLSSGTSKLRNHRLALSTCMGTVDGYGKVFGTKLLGLGKGAYYVQVTYNDQTTETITGTNVLKNVNKNDTITLLDADKLAVDQHDGIDKVSVVFLHTTKANNVLGVGYVQDWITENVFNFN